MFNTLASQYLLSSRRRLLIPVALSKYYVLLKDMCKIVHSDGGARILDNHHAICAVRDISSGDL